MSSVRQLSFAGGEISPALYGRVDLVKYATGVRTLRNFLVARHGGASNRPGTAFIGEVKDSTKVGRLVQWIFNADQTYVLVFGDQTLRFIRNGAYIQVSGVAAWNNGVNYVIGDLVVEGGINYYCILGHINQQPPNATYWHPLTGAIYEIPTPYLAADLDDLGFVQSADVLTLTHQSYAPRELARTGHTAWTLTEITFAPSIAAPAGPAVAGGTGAGKDWIYVITAVKDETFEESLPSASATRVNVGDPTAAAPNVVSWTAVAGAVEYNIYRQKAVPTATTPDGIFGYLGTSSNTTFNDNNSVDPDFADTPPAARNPFSGAGNFPAVSGYFQQRQLYANTTNEPETVQASRSANFKNFTVSQPLQDDDALTFPIRGRYVNAVRHILDLGKLIILTSDGEWLIEGGADGILAPGEINPKQQSYYGSSTLPPIIVGGDALFVQARGSIVRDLAFELESDSYRGNDLTIFSSHLVDAYTLVDWAYQQNRNSVVWIVRSDGVLLGLTYIKTHQIFAWHRHDTDGDIENVCVVPEGTEDRLYLLVKRTINGVTKRYIERMHTRLVSDIIDAVFLDSSLTYDGRNTDVTKTMTLTGGVDWDQDETLTLTCSAAQFDNPGDVGNEIHLYIKDSDGAITDVVRCQITAVTSPTVASVKPHKTVPTTLRVTATDDWADAVDTVSGLSHLEAKQVSVFADGFVVASPNNAAYTVLTVAAGAITLERPYATIHVGLPYLSDLETLNIDTAQGETISDKAQLVTKATVFVESSRGLWVGGAPPEDDDDDPLEGLRELKIRNTEGYDKPIDLATETVEVKFDNTWNSHGRVFMRQVDPLPLSILTVVPAGFIPIRS